MRARKPTIPEPVTTGQQWEREIGRLLDGIHGCAWLPIPPAMRAGRRVTSGAPDIHAIYQGAPHYIECKMFATGNKAPLGLLVRKVGADGKEKDDGGSVSPENAAVMDQLTAAGGRCWIACMVVMSEAAQRKAAQVTLDGTGGDVPAVIRRLVPWGLWRARMAAAEEARRTGGDVQASIPAVELAGMGWPLRTAGELRAALLVDNPGDKSGGAS